MAVASRVSLGAELSSTTTISRNAVDTIGVPLTLTNNLSLDDGTTSTLSITASIGGTGTVTKTGSGTITLAAADTYSQATSVSAGILQMIGTPTVQSVAIGSSSFESGTPALPGTGGFEYSTALLHISGGSWTFAPQVDAGAGVGALTGGDGLIVPPSAFNSPPAPDGSQIAFVQNLGSISQTLNFASPGQYTLTLLAAGRSGENGANTIQVEMDGSPAGAAFTPRVSPATGATATFTAETISFTVYTPGQHTLSFNGILPRSNGDSTTFIDTVAISGTPFSANDVTVAGGATLDLAGTNQSVLSLSGAGTVEDSIGTSALTLVGTSSNIFSGFIGTAGSGTLSLVRGGFGTTVLNNVNPTYGAGVTINSGATLSLGNGSATLVAVPTSQGIIDNGLLLINQASGQSLTEAAVISGSGAVSINTLPSESATVTLQATDTYTGATSLGAGTLDVTGSLTGSSSVNMSNGTTLNVSGSISSGGTVTANPASMLNVTGSIAGGIVNVIGSALSLSGSITNSRHRQHQRREHVQRLRHDLRRHAERHRDKHDESLSGSVVSAIVNASSGTLTLAATGVTDAASTVNVGLAGTLNGTGAILGTATVTGNGIISLSGTTISGPLLVSGGSWLSTATVLGGVAVDSGSFTVSAPILSPLGIEVYGGTTALDASIPGALYVNGSGATVNVGSLVGSLVSVASADFSAGTGIVNATNPLMITNGLRLANGSNTVNLTGASIIATGSNLVQDSGRTLTVSSGTLGLSATTAPSTVNTVGYDVVTSASSGISSSNTYTHAIDIGDTFGAGAAISPTINGVQFFDGFTSSMTGSLNSTLQFTGSTSSNLNYDTSIPNSGSSVGLYNLYNNFLYNAPTTQLTLTGLTPGAYYEVRLYMRTFGTTADTRVLSFSNTVGNSPAPIATQIGSSYIVDEDDPASTTPGINSAAWLALVNANGGFATTGMNGTSGVNGWAMDVTYQADPTGKFTIQAVEQIDTFTLHVYGFTNQVVPTTNPGVISLPGTSFVLAGTSTFNLGATSATFGSVTIPAGSNLTVQNGTAITVNGFTTTGTIGSTTVSTGTVPLTSTGTVKAAAGTSLGVPALGLAGFATDRLERRLRLGHRFPGRQPRPDRLEFDPPPSPAASSPPRPAPAPSPAAASPSSGRLPSTSAASAPSASPA